PLFDVTARLVFATNPAAIIAGVDCIENGAVGDFALVRLGAAGYGGNLDVADQVPVAPEFGEDVAFGDADVIDIEHESNVVVADCLDDGCGFADGRIQIAGLIARVERLQQQRQAGLPRFVCGVGQIGLEHFARRGFLALGNDTGHGMDG